jgi:hypothetical protein
MKNFYLLTLLLCFQANAKIHTIEDLELKKPQTKSLRERVGFNVIYGGDFNKDKRDVKSALDQKKISSLLYYQLINLIKKDKFFDSNYYEDENLRNLKLSLLNLSNKSAIENIVRKKENNLFISDLIIKDVFDNKDSHLKNSVLKLKNSANLDILLIKINHQKNNFDFLERSLIKIDKQNKIIVLDLLIQAKGADVDISLLIKRNQLQYETLYAEQLISYYLKNKKNELAELELEKLLYVRKDIKLLKSLLNLRSNELNQTDFDVYKIFIEANLWNELKLIMIELLYKKAKAWDELIKDFALTETNKNEWYFYKSVDLVKLKKEEEALALIEKSKLLGDARIDLLKSKLMILNKVEILDEKNVYFNLSKEINSRVFLEQAYEGDYPLKNEMDKKEYKLIDFYRAYEAIDKDDKLSLIKCLFIYNKIYEQLSFSDKELIKVKMGALNFE